MSVQDKLLLAVRDAARFLEATDQRILEVSEQTTDDGEKIIIVVAERNIYEISVRQSRR
jgi:hypothetical protein